MRLALLVPLALVLLCGCDLFAGPRSFVEDRRRFRTDLVLHEPAVQRGLDPGGPGVEQLRYRSMRRQLDAWLVRERSAALLSGRGAPLLVYLHEAYAAGEGDVDAVRPFVDAGFAVLLPSYRGENGNAGDFEMRLGELEDARAALDHARTLEGIDADRIVVFGHGAGGVLSALLAMYPDLGVVATGSAGGLHDVDALDAEQVSLPFRDTPEERRMRVPVPHLAELRQSHWACIGRADPILSRATEATERASAAGAPIELTVVSGDRAGSLRACVRGFLDHVQPRIAEASPAGAEATAPRTAAGVGSGPFDLAAAGDGAVLVWSAFGEARLRTRRIGPLGELLGDEATVLGEYDGAVREVAVAVNGDRMAVAWVETDGRTTALHARAASGPIEGPLGRAIALGDVDPAAMTVARGNVAIAARGEGFVAAVRAAREGGARIALLPIDRGMRARRTVDVEQPCARALVGTAQVGSDVALGVCSGSGLVRVLVGDGEPSVTRIDAGCEDVALVDAGGEHVVARCGGPHPIDEGSRVLVPVCEDAVPRLGSNIVLRTAASGLGALFEDAIAPSGAPAVWTGRALVVATRDRDVLMLYRTECRETSFERTAEASAQP